MTTPRFPFIAFDNQLESGVPVASSTGSGNVNNLTDFRMGTFWSPSALPATITVDGARGSLLAQSGSELVASDGAAVDEYGYSVAISGDGLVMAVGSRRWEGALSNQGGVYIYDRSGNSWVMRGSVLQSPSPLASQFFGYSVALNSDGSVLVVGADGYNGGLANQGGVFTFDWTAGAWVQRGTVLVAADAAATDRFGSVAISSDGLVLAVGAFLWESSGTDRGCVYIFDDVAGVWTQRGSVITASDAEDSDNFGYSVALNSSGSMLAVGAYAWEGSVSGQGGVYIYDWSGSAWVQRGSVLTAGDYAQFSGQFGYDVSLSYDGLILAVGAALQDCPISNQGMMFIFDYIDSAWVLRQTLKADAVLTNEYFGIGGALNGEGSLLAVGATGRNANKGSVLTYTMTNYASRLSVYGHDIATKGRYLEVRGSTDGFVASDALVATVYPSSDAPFVADFTRASYRWWRIKVLGTTMLPSISIAVLGDGIEFPTGLPFDAFSPLNRRPYGQSNISEYGQPLGSAILYEGWQQTLSFRYITQDWVRSTFIPAWESHLRGRPFLFAHDLTNYPNEVMLVTSAGEMTAPNTSPVYTTLNFPVKGVAL